MCVCVSLSLSVSVSVSVTHIYSCYLHLAELISDKLGGRCRVVEDACSVRHQEVTQ